MDDDREVESIQRVTRKTAPGGRCNECHQPYRRDEEYTQVVEGGAGIARGHRECIEAAWGPEGRH